jgi:hypothetical protein
MKLIEVGLGQSLAGKVRILGKGNKNAGWKLKYP